MARSVLVKELGPPPVGRPRHRKRGLGKGCTRYRMAQVPKVRQGEAPYVPERKVQGE